MAWVRERGEKWGKWQLAARGRGPSFLVLPLAPFIKFFFKNKEINKAGWGIIYKIDSSDSHDERGARARLRERVQCVRTTTVCVC